MHGSRAKEWIRDNGLAAPAGIGKVSKASRRLVLGNALLVHQQDTRARRKTGPGPVGCFESVRQTGALRRHVGFDQTAPDELERAHRIAGPEHVRLRVLRLGDQAVEDAGALGLLGIVDRTDPDAGLAFKSLEHRLRKDLVDGCVSDHVLS